MRSNIPKRPAANLLHIVHFRLHGHQNDDCRPIRRFLSSRARSRGHSNRAFVSKVRVSTMVRSSKGPFAPASVCDRARRTRVVASLPSNLSPATAMSRHFDPHLVNDPFGDPALYVQLVFERRALLFDMGDLSRLSPRQNSAHQRCLHQPSPHGSFFGLRPVPQVPTGSRKGHWLLRSPGSHRRRRAQAPDPHEQQPQCLPLGTLKKEIMRITAGRKIAYVVDCAFTDANADRIISLAKDADTLFIEAAFLDEDRSRAAHRRHLTARQAGTLARLANVKRLVTLHYSPRYQGRGDCLAREAQAAFES